MGNCFAGCHKSAAEIAPFDCIKPSAVNASAAAMSSGVSSSAAAVVTTPATSTVRLYGPAKSLETSYVRFALLHKRVSVRFIPSENEKLSLQIGSDMVSGSRETLLRFIEEKFAEPRLMMGKFNLEGFDDTTSLVLRLTWLQHRSMVWHLERMFRWVEDLTARGGRRAVDPAAGTPRMELRKFGNSYSQLQELMLEHAQMEERILFPVLESVDRELCKAANEEHGRQLPMINGIKEDIKSIGVLDSGSPVCHEALSSLSSRFKSLRERCKEHYEEEERDLLPFMEAAEMSRDQQKRLLNQSIDVMKGTHSHLFEFFLDGLLPQEAMQYLDLIMKFGDEERISSMHYHNVK